MATNDTKGLGMYHEMSDLAPMRRTAKKSKITPWKTTSISPALETFIDTTITPRKAREVKADLLTKGFMCLDKPSSRQSVRKEKASKRKKLTSKEKRKLNLFDIGKEGHKFSTYLPIHTLWKSYMEQLISPAGLKMQSMSNALEKMLKADYHGCFLTVARSICPSYVGTSGIVLKETKNTFKLITPDDRVKSIPKAHTVFKFELDQYCFTMYGNQFLIRAGERARKKFKPRSTVDL